MVNISMLLEHLVMKDAFIGIGPFVGFVPDPLNSLLWKEKKIRKTKMEDHIDYGFEISFSSISPNDIISSLRSRFSFTPNGPGASVSLGLGYAF
jgi:hypothetical protein